MTEHLKVAWYDFESEPEMTGDGSGNLETHYLTIAVVEEDGSKGDEIAVICHRLVGGKYPLDGLAANEKRRYAQIIVDALNHDHPEVPDALVGEFRYADQLAHQGELAICRHCRRTIAKTDEGWIDPEATGDDNVWRETCDAHDTFVAEHEPQPIVPSLSERLSESRNPEGWIDGVPQFWDANSKSWMAL